MRKRARKRRFSAFSDEKLKKDLNSLFLHVKWFSSQDSACYETQFCS
ncbi:hypothetical protein HMPREF3036_02492 [Sutterella sp. KLE1602]|nr:hypothetical protein HMPREF3036_02492 [Sutterella sp. KLE1602]